jgi:hypothetical protein
MKRATYIFSCFLLACVLSLPFDLLAQPPEKVEAKRPNQNPPALPEIVSEEETELDRQVKEAGLRPNEQGVESLPEKRQERLELLRQRAAENRELIQSEKPAPPLLLQPPGALPEPVKERLEQHHEAVEAKQEAHEQRMDEWRQAKEEKLQEWKEAQKEKLETWQEGKQDKFEVSKQARKDRLADLGEKKPQGLQDLSVFQGQSQPAAKQTAGVELYRSTEKPAAVSRTAEQAPQRGIAKAFEQARENKQSPQTTTPAARQSTAGKQTATKARKAVHVKPSSSTSRTDGAISRAGKQSKKRN